MLFYLCCISVGDNGCAQVLSWVFHSAFLNALYFYFYLVLVNGNSGNFNISKTYLKMLLFSWWKWVCASAILELTSNNPAKGIFLVFKNFFWIVYALLSLLLFSWWQWVCSSAILKLTSNNPAKGNWLSLKKVGQRRVSENVVKKSCLKSRSNRDVKRIWWKLS